MSVKIHCILGPPGSGKTTYGKRKAPFISCGQILREYSETNPDFKKYFIEVISKGELLPDEISTPIIIKCLLMYPDPEIWIDGFPKSEYQLEAISELGEVDFHVISNVPRSVCEERMSRRGRSDDVELDSIRKRLDHWEQVELPLIQKWSTMVRTEWIQ